MPKIIFVVYITLTFGCNAAVNQEQNTINTVPDSVPKVLVSQDTNIITTTGERVILRDTVPTVQLKSDVPVDSIVNFAETLIGIPYKYASANPAEGFDCSGFITYVFNHFNIEVPRSSIGFTNAGTEVLLAEAKRGDLVLFTGTDSLATDVGHMGIVVSNNSGHVEFIHSTSGKAYGVVITPLNEYYRKRFVKVVRW